METEKGKTYKYLREKREVSQAAKDKMKQFNTIKKEITNALKEEELTISQLTEKLNMPQDEVMYWLMSLLKYGYVQKGSLDDMDEYFTYKIKE